MENKNELQQTYAYCPVCHRITGIWEEPFLCPSCGTSTVQTMLSGLSELSHSLENQWMVRWYTWKEEYASHISHFYLRYHRHEFLCSQDSISYHQTNQDGEKTISLTANLSGVAWNRILAYLRNLDFSKLVTPYSLALRYSGNENISASFVCCHLLRGQFCYFPATPGEYPQEITGLFDLVAREFQQTRLFTLLKKYGASIDGPFVLPYVHTVIQDNLTGEMHRVQIPFGSRVLFGSKPNMHISVPPLLPVYALFHRDDYFLIKGGYPGMRDKEVWDGQNWGKQTILRKGDRFRLHGQPFTLVDFQVIPKQQLPGSNPGSYHTFL